ncbi:hypothetical protein CH275_16495 [Rhodococcus sp. 06-235-1A]|nr:hypothetical protein CH275_16495 [Rhodococcus sp. 06-235-1A]
MANSTSPMVLHRTVQEWATLRYRLGLEQPNCALRQRIAVGVSDTSDQCCNPLEHRRFLECDRRVESALAAGAPL